MENEENTVYPFAPAEVSERLWTNRNNPDVLAAYDYHYGPGAADAYLDERAGTTPEGDAFIIPNAAIEWLESRRGQENELAASIAFNNRYGAGAAESVLGGSNEQPQEESGESPGFLTEAWRAVAGGAVDAAAGVAQTADDIGDWAIGSFVGDIVQTEEGWRYIRGDEYRAWQEQQEEGQGNSSLDMFSNWSEGLVAENETTAGQIGRGVSTFLVPYLGAARTLNIGTSIWRGAALGAAVDFSVWDPNDPNLTALAVQIGAPEGWFTELMATDPDDEANINRLRNAVEGVGVGILVDGIIAGARYIRAGRAAVEAGDEAAADAARAGLRSVVEETEGGAAQAIGDTIADNINQAAETSARIEAAQAAEAEARASSQGEAPTEGSTPTPEAPRPNNGFSMTPDQHQRAAELAQVFSRNPEEAFSRNLAWRSVTTYQGWEDVAADMAAQARVMSEEFENIRSGAGNGPVQTWEMLGNQASRRLNEIAAEIGQDRDSLIRNWNLRGEPHEWAPEFLARESLLRHLAGEVQTLAKAISESNLEGTTYRNMMEAREAFTAQMEIIANVTARQNAMRTNIARSLNAMKAAKLGRAEIDNILQASQMSRGLDASIEAVAKGNMTPAQAALDAPRGQTWLDRINNYRINAMLSGPGTQEVNIISTALNTLMGPMRTIIGGEVRHGLRQFAGMVYGAFDSLSATGRALRDDMAILDPGSTKFDVDLAKGDKGFVGSVIGLPSRLLLTGDELFKQSAYRGYIYADAVQGATQRGLKGAQRRDYIQSYIRDSFNADGSANLAGRTEAFTMAQRATFTEPLRPGSFPAKVQSAALVGEGIGPFIARLIVPFFRTPVNILKQSFQHMPMARLISKELQEDLAAGGARAAQAKAKARIGTTVLLAGAGLAVSGRITGSGPSDPQVNAEWRNAGYQPYSIRFEDENGNVRWVSYQRLEPLANVLSIISDVIEIHQNPYNEDYSSSANILGALVMAIMENTVNKTFTQGIADFMDVLQAEDNKAEMALNRFITSFIPNAMNQTNGDELFREARTLLDHIRARTGEYAHVAPRRNVLGEVIERPNSKADPLGLFTSRGYQPIDPVLQELNRISIADRTAFQRPNHSVQLDGRRQSLKEIYHSETGRPLYDMWMERTGTIEIGGVTLRESLERLFASRSYQVAPDSAQAQEVSQIISGYRRAARADIPELVEVLRRVAEQAAEAQATQAGERRSLFNTGQGSGGVDPYSSFTSAFQ